MDFQFRPISMEEAEEIEEWHYEGKFEDLYMTPYFISADKGGPIKGPGGCDGFVALYEGKVAGLFEYTLDAGVLVIGLALSPDFVGKGGGADFVRQGIAFGLATYDDKIDVIELEVNRNNKPAIRVYEKVGFSKIRCVENEVVMRLKV